MLLLTDHLGSTSVTADYNGDTSSIRWFKAFGELRYQSGTLLTNYLYTGQRFAPETGLYDYGPRVYDPALGRWTLNAEPDTVVPVGVQGVQAWDRYAKY